MRDPARACLGLVLVAVACASSGRTERAAGAAAASGGAVIGGFELAAGVVVDPSRPAVYLARPGGGIEALEAATGQPLWRSAEAARPLLLDGGRLLAQRESGPGLPLALLDAASGNLLRSYDLLLPAGVRAAVDESLAGSFRLSARAAGGDAILEWEYRERHALGVSPPEDRPFARRELGALRLVLASGEATPLALEAAAAAVAEPLPAPVERLLAAGALRRPVWRAGEVLAAAEQRHQPGGGRLVLRRWAAGDGVTLPEIVLREGRPVAVLAAADRRHLLVVSPLAAAGRSAAYLWEVHELASGELVARRDAERSASPFCLVGDLLLHLEPPSGRRVEGGWEERPLRLVAGRPDGERLWQEPIRDPAFRGPAPPRP